MLGLLGGQLAVELAGRAGGGVHPLAEELLGAAFQRQRHLHQLQRVLRVVVTAGLQHAAVQAVTGVLRRGQVVAAQQRVEVLALHRRQPAEHVVQVGVVGGGRGGDVEVPPAELDLHRVADGLQRVVLLGHRAGLHRHQRAAARRAAAVWEGEALAALGARGALPRHHRAGAAEPVLAVVLVARFERPPAAGAHRHARGYLPAGAAVGDVLPAEVAEDGCGSPAPGAHGQDDRGPAGDDVAAGEHTRQVGGLGDRVGGHVAPVVQFQPRRVAGDDRVRVRTQRHDHRVALDVHPLTGGLRPAPPLVVRLAELHALHRQAAHLAIGVGEHLHRVVQPHEVHALFLGVEQLLGPGRRLLAGAAVHAAHVRPQAAGHAQAVHRRVAGADHHDVGADADRRVDVREAVAAHQVDAGEELVGADHPAGVLTRDAEERGGTGADPEEHGVEAAALHQVLHRERAADHLVGLDRHPERQQAVDLAVDDLPRQAERRDAVAQHAAGHVQGLEHGDVDPGAGQVGGARQPGGAGADDGHPLAGPLGGRFGDLLRLHVPVVADEALQAADGHRLHPLADDALALALGLLRAHPAAHRRQDAGLADDAEGAVHVLHQEVADEAGDVDLHGAAADARRPAALQATLCLAQRLAECVPQRHLVERA